jgi:hypothetical protein
VLEVPSAAERAAYESSQQTNAFGTITTRQLCTAALRTKTNRFGRKGMLKGIETMALLGNRWLLVSFWAPFNTVAPPPPKP